MLPPLPPLSSTPQLGWEADGDVRAVASSGSVVFIGGGFRHVGPPGTANGAVVANDTGVPRYGLPRVDGAVLAVASDGAGGWFVGGRFQTVGGVSCPRLARVRADLTVDPAFCPRPAQLPPGEEPGGVNNGGPEVRALLRDGEVLYVGGTFRRIGGIDAQGSFIRRAHLAALSTATGQPLPWNPGPIERNDGTIQSESGPASDGIGAGVNALARVGTTLYVGGAFSQVNGAPRASVAAVSTVDASLLPFAARVADGITFGNAQGTSGQVFALAVSGSLAVIGGRFQLVNGVGRGGLAAVDRTSGALASGWAPNAGGTIRALRVVVPITPIRGCGREGCPPPILYVGGAFSTGIRGTGPPGTPPSGPNVAALNAATGAVVPWGAGADGPVRALALTGGNITLGGAFQAVGGVPRPGAAMVAAATAPTPGAVLPWSPRVSGFTFVGAEPVGVAALASAGTDVYVGGGFDHVGGVDRAGLAAIDTQTGEATAWDARLEGGSRSVDALVVRDQTLYASGSFTAAAGQQRAGLAGLSTASAAATAWQPAALPGPQPPPGLLSGPAGIYLLGRAPVPGALETYSAVATDPTTGTAGPWSPAVATVRLIGGPPEEGIPAAAVSGDQVILGGTFRILGGQDRRRLGSVSATTGAVTGWTPDASGFETVRAVAPRAGVAFVGGRAANVPGATRGARLAAVDAVTGAATAWAPAFGGSSAGSVDVILHTGPDVVVGGNFGFAGGAFRTGLAAFSPTAPAELRAFDARLDGTVRALGVASPGTKLVVGGTFGSAGGRPLRGIAIFPRQPDVGDSSATVRRTGVWRAPVRCPAGTAGSCRVRARLRELATPRRRVIGVAAATVAAGRVVRLRFPVTRAGLALLRARRRVPVRVEVTSRDRLGNRTTGERRFTLTPGR